jgi:predicted permease
LGIKPALGRGFLPEEDQRPGGNPVAVLSHGLWRRRFGADPGILGRSVVMNNRSYTVVGVAPAGFYGVDRGFVPEFWAPLSMHTQMMPELGKDLESNRDNQWLTLTGRLKPGVTREQALAAVNVVHSRILDTYHKGEKKSTVSLTTAGGIIAARGYVLGLMTVLMVVVGLVLLVACANVANLLLARATARQKEIGIRLALGAGRGRLIRQLLTESLLLAMAGAGVGFLLSLGATRAISQFQLPLPFPVGFDFSPDRRVFAFTAALSVLTGILFGLAPAVRATRLDLVAALKEQAAALGSFRRFGLRNLLVVVQVTLSLVLLVSAGLFLRSLQSASSIDIGMRPDNVLVMAVDPKLHNYSAEKTKQFFGQLQQRVSALPGVLSMSLVDIVPLSIGGSSNRFESDGSQGSRKTGADVSRVSTRYFETMGIPLLRGRDFPAERNPARRVAVVNEILAKRLFPDEDPIGRQVRSHNQTYEIIGVARNSKSRTLGEDPKACFYHFLDQDPSATSSFFGVAVVVKTSGNPAAMIRPVRQQVEALDPNLAVFNIETMKEHVGKALLIPRLCGWLFGVFGLVGLTLATVGLYGVMSYSVRRRTREIGIRMALGAPASGVLRMVAGQGLVLAAAGIAAGLALALTASRFAASFLYGISAMDRATFIGVPLVLLAVALVAILLPARRAARVDPLVALRYE